MEKPSLKTYADIVAFLEDAAQKFLAEEYDNAKLKACIALANEARGLAEDRSKYQSALESLLNQAKGLPQRKSGDAPIHGSPFPILSAGTPQLI